MRPKVYGLELLRGICALLVAIYHCLAWGHVIEIYNWGNYGVYVFFAISGAVLYESYHVSIGKSVSIGQFVLRRFARIAPLYIFCMVASAIGQKHDPSLQHFLNLTLLFGFGNPGQTSAVTGGWSLGIEFVFYFIFPTLLAFTVNKKMALIIAAVFFALRYSYISIVLNDETLVSGWRSYAQPASFICFFFGGMLIARLSPYFNSNLTMKIIGLISFLVLFGTFSENEELLITGFTGVFLSILAVLVVAGFYWSPNGTFAISICKFFGEISYGLYLIHPLIWGGLNLISPSMNVSLKILLTLSLGILSALISIRFFENPMKKLILKISKTN